MNQQSNIWLGCDDYSYSFLKIIFNIHKLRGLSTRYSKININYQFTISALAHLLNNHILNEILDNYIFPNSYIYLSTDPTIYIILNPAQFIKLCKALAATEIRVNGKIVRYWDINAITRDVTGTKLNMFWPQILNDWTLLEIGDMINSYPKDHGLYIISYK